MKFTRGKILYVSFKFKGNKKNIYAKAAGDRLLRSPYALNNICHLRYMAYMIKHEI